ncbi:MAG TPA: hypothetical protein VFF14_03430 [Candidatus Deferrimicrobium sp.]|nr:hypothetical protein [Candidatus Deferrimicrobium sp.]
MRDSSRKGSRGCLKAAVITMLLLGLIIGVGLIGVFLLITPQSIQVTRTASPLLPEFPWPPPKPSTIAYLTLGSLRQKAGTGLTFHDVDARISQALATAGYDEKSYYGVPNGFAIVTRLEQMNLDGSPEYSDRWVASLSPVTLTRFSLAKYLEALFGVPKGHYRIFVFIITSDIVIQSGTPVTQGEAQNWFVEGANKLPSDMETLPYTNEHTTTVYIYEFVQSGVGANANQNIPSSVTGKQHLERAGLWNALQ